MLLYVTADQLKLYRVIVTACGGANQVSLILNAAATADAKSAKSAAANGMPLDMQFTHIFIDEPSQVGASE